MSAGQRSHDGATLARRSCDAPCAFATSCPYSVAFRRDAAGDRRWSRCHVLAALWHEVRHDRAQVTS